MQQKDLRDYNFFTAIRMRDKVVGWVIIVAPIAAIVFLLKLFHRPEALERRYVYGCYVSDVAPRMLITAQSILFDQSNFLDTEYEVKAEKQGYTIYPKANIILNRTVRGQFTFAESPNNTSFPLLAEHYDEPRRLRHLSQFSGRLYAFSRQADRIVYSRMIARGICLHQWNGR